MKKLKLFSVLLLSGLLAVSCSDDENISTTDDAMNVKGSETFAKDPALSGAHYNLNIIGVQNPKTAVMDGSNGHVIFVPLEGKIAIELQKGDFAVLDANGTDGVAQFQLPDPGLDPYVVGGDMLNGDGSPVDTMSDYSVFVRPLGKPGGWSTITTCAEVVNSNLAAFLGAKTLTVLNNAASLGGVASVEQVGSTITTRPKGKSTFTNVTAQLLTIVLKVTYDVDGDPLTIGDIYTVYVRVPIFDDLIENEYWEYDNHGLKLLQVRFYPVGTDVSWSDLYLPNL